MEYSTLALPDDFIFVSIGPLDPSGLVVRNEDRTKEKRSVTLQPSQERVSMCIVMTRIVEINFFLSYIFIFSFSMSTLLSEDCPCETRLRSLSGT